MQHREIAQNIIYVWERRLAYWNVLTRSPSAANKGSQADKGIILVGNRCLLNIPWLQTHRKKRTRRTACCTCIFIHSPFFVVPPSTSKNGKKKREKFYFRFMQTIVNFVKKIEQMCNPRWVRLWVGSFKFTKNKQFERHFLSPFRRMG